MSQPSDVVEFLRGRGVAVAFLDVLFSCIGMFITVMALQSAMAQESPPPIGTDAYFGLLANGSVMQATSKGVETARNFEAAIKGALDAADTVYPRLEILFSGASIDRQRVHRGQLDHLMKDAKATRLLETNWRPAASDEAVREELELIARKLAARKDKKDK